MVDRLAWCLWCPLLIAIGDTLIVYYRRAGVCLVFGCAMMDGAGSPRPSVCPSDCLFPVLFTDLRVACLHCGLHFTVLLPLRCRPVAASTSIDAVPWAAYSFFLSLLYSRSLRFVRLRGSKLSRLIVDIDDHNVTGNNQ